MIAVCAAKFVGYVCKKMGRQGVTWAGKVAIKICPDILEQLSSQVRKAIFVTCGTNGKTTTNNMLCAALEAEGQKVICNHTGSNMLNGVVAALCWLRNGMVKLMRTMHALRPMKHPPDIFFRESNRTICF